MSLEEPLENNLGLLADEDDFFRPSENMNGDE